MMTWHRPRMAVSLRSQQDADRSVECSCKSIGEDDRSIANTLAMLYPSNAPIADLVLGYHYMKIG